MVMVDQFGAKHKHNKLYNNLLIMLDELVQLIFGLRLCNKICVVTYIYVYGKCAVIQTKLREGQILNLISSIPINNEKEICLCRRISFLQKDIGTYFRLSRPQPLDQRIGNNCHD
jgi:hypothetical protein